MSGYKGLNNPNTNDLLKNHMNAITNTSRSARLYGRLFAFQDTAMFVVNKLKEKSFELKDLSFNLLITNLAVSSNANNLPYNLDDLEVFVIAFI